jgi:tetratricopeptide (TPR) repeat protein
MGVVYEVIDAQRGQAIALKTLLHFDPAGLYRFKQEFRTLADVQHKNLVRLYELVIRETGETFFTMELVRGKTFTEYTCAMADEADSVPAPTHRDAPGAPRCSTPPPAESGMLERAVRTPRSSGRAMLADEGRLRSALSQLVAGVKALHAAGKLHRDIKPANALVTDEGRVVLLDFGVATELSNRSTDSAGGSGEIVGTASYMAPEQGEEGPPSPASDWYSVGVMLYEALVGRPPFVGSAIDTITLKNTLEAPLPSDSVDGVPPDLDALCHALLAIHPDHRPDGDEILRRLGAGPATSSARPAITTAAGDHEAPIVGRERPLQSLAEAFESSRRGQTTTVFVAGASGMGKTRLVNHFLDELVASRRALVLRGRAYEREALPYKAFDAVIDSLSRQLVSLLENGHGVALPDDAWLLGRLFPVLRSTPGFEAPPDRRVDEPGTARRRAFMALRELLGSLAGRTPVVIFVDDVHWGDVDSAALLLELVRPPGPAGFLLVMTHRDAKEESPFLREIADQWPAAADRRRITVDVLTLEDAQRLALQLLGTTDPATARSAWAVARESMGQPFLIEELVRANRGHVETPAGGELAVISVDEMISERLARLPEFARRLAEVVAVGGRPLPVPVAIHAAKIDASAVDDVVAMVCSRRFAHAGLRDGHDVLEPTQDQIRERVVALLSSDLLRQHHASLAIALEGSPDRDGEAVAEHWLGAGEWQRAAVMARAAAEEALVKLAFDQAARLFRLALDHTPAASPDANGLHGRLAQALQMAGRSTESGREYLQAASSAAPARQLTLRRIAAEQLLAAGRIEEAQPILYEVLASSGIRAPRSPRAAAFWLAVYAAWLRLRGFAFEERDSADVDHADHMRVEALYTVGIGFGFVNPILSVCMQKRQILEAIRVGDRSQVLMALSIQINHMGNAYPHELERERALVVVARDLARRTGPPHLESYVDASVGIGRFFRGQWSEARELLERAEVGAREMGNRAVAVNARLFAAYSLYYTGDFAEYRRRCERLIAEAEDRGDLYTTISLRSTAMTRWLVVAGETQRAHATLREVLAQWPQKDFSVQHWQVMIQSADVDIYDGHGGRAYDDFVRSLRVLEKSMMLKNWYIRTSTLHARGRVAIASILSHPGSRRARIAEARRVARQLAREPNAWAIGISAAIRASAAIADGDRQAAVKELRGAIALNANRSEYLAIAARYRLGELLDGDEGRALLRGARETLEREWGAKDVPRYVHMLIPGEL